MATIEVDDETLALLRQARAAGEAEVDVVRRAVLALIERQGGERPAQT